MWVFKSPLSIYGWIETISTSEIDNDASLCEKVIQNIQRIHTAQPRDGEEPAGLPSLGSH